MQIPRNKFCMQLSKNIVNGPKSNNYVFWWEFGLFGHIFILGHFYMTEKGVMTKFTCFFSVISKQPRSVTEKSQKPGWNTVKGNVFDFPDNSIRSALHGCCSFGSNCLILHTVEITFFNELIQCGDDGLSSWANSNLKTAQLDNGFCFLIDKPTTQISWTSSEISVVSLS